MVQLQAQLPVLHGFIAENNAEITISAISQRISCLSEAQKVACPQVWVFLMILLIMPAANTASEHSFSTLLIVKTYNSARL
jgi:hypothetical protein